MRAAACGGLRDVAVFDSSDYSSPVPRAHARGFMLSPSTTAGEITSQRIRGEPRPRVAGDSVVGFRPAVVVSDAMPLLRAGFCNRLCSLARFVIRPRIPRPRNVAASCQPTGSSSNISRKSNGSSAVPRKRGLSVYIAPSPKRLVISVAHTLSTKASLLSSSNDGSLNCNGRRDGLILGGRFVYISPT